MVGSLFSSFAAYSWSRGGRLFSRGEQDEYFHIFVISLSFSFPYPCSLVSFIYPQPFLNTFFDLFNFQSSYSPDHILVIFMSFPFRCPCPFYDLILLILFLLFSLALFCPCPQTFHCPFKVLNYSLSSLFCPFLFSFSFLCPYSFPVLDIVLSFSFSCSRHFTFFFLFQSFPIPSLSIPSLCLLPSRPFPCACSHTCPFPFKSLV